MARDSSGPHNEPQYAGTGVPADAADLSEIATYAAAVGNRKIGPTTSGTPALGRTTATGADVWEGLEWQDTTDGFTYVSKSGGWVKPNHVLADIATFGTGYAPTDAAGHKPRVRRIGDQCFLYGALTTSSGFAYSNLLTLPAAFQPPTTATRFIGTNIAATGAYQALYELILAGGVVSISTAFLSGSIAAAGTIVPVVGSWWMD
jgi:hypothetical protein